MNARDLFGQQPEPLITEDMIEEMKARDERIKAVDLMLQLANELQKSLLVKIFLEEAKKHADKSLEELAFTDPTDTKKIIQLQAHVYRARFISSIIASVNEKGIQAEKSLREDSSIG